MNRHLKAGVVTVLVCSMPIAVFWGYHHFPKITASVLTAILFGLLICVLYGCALTFFPEEEK